jgi:hypothetical protein
MSQVGDNLSVMTLVLFGNQIEAAYQRGDLREKRHKMINTWASYCLSGDT